MQDKNTDIVIVGAGPAGLTAGIYTARAGMQTLIFEKAASGGQIITTELVENYPGFPDAVNGYELGEKMRAQAERFGVQIKAGEVTQIISHNKKVYQIETDEGIYTAKAVIIASGAQPKKLEVPGEAAFTGRGVSYCAVCDGRFFTGKEVVVVGGGDTAVEEALFLTKFCTKVTLVHRRDQFRAAKVLQDRLKANSKIQCVLDSVIQEICGDAKVHFVRIQNKKTNQVSEIACAGVFLFVGYAPNTAWLGGLLEMDAQGYIMTDQKMETSQRGIFACGDVRAKTLRQVVTACGDGAVAAFSAQAYIEHISI